MTFFDYALYLFWFIGPLFYFAVMLYSQLEKWSGQSPNDDMGYYFKQAMFLTSCAAVSIFIDSYLFPRISNHLPFFPLVFYRVILFPMVMLILGKIVGGSAEIKVEKNPKLKHNRKKSKS
ncbi:MAG: hypothetical protein SGJ02_09070 [bacterium]|nr:hypothetical protein [bacterium]